MEPLDDRELNHLLKQWKAPATPASIHSIVKGGHRVLPRRAPWWRWLFVGAIRVPVPVMVAIVAVVALLFYFRTSDKPKPEPQNASQPGTVSLADFQPVRQLEPRVIGRGYEAH
jgi:hypothetical protein